MPKELIETRSSGLIRAYLAEARSIGGLSGSPVFVHFGIGRHGALVVRQDPFYFLGLVHGHFNQFGEMDSAVDDIDLTKFRPPENEPLNTGIAIVVPSEDIEEVLDRHELASAREAARAIVLEKAKQSLPVED
jgi:hypothetical protein